MAKRRSVHAALDELRQHTAAERVKARDVSAQLEAAKHDVERASHAIADGYAAEDQQAVNAAREAEQAAIAKLRELQHRLAGAETRVQRAQQQADSFTHAHAHDLLAEREQSARTVSAELTAAGHELVRLHRAYVAERTAIDQLVAAVPGATPRADGPAATYPWEPELQALARAVAETPEVDAPLPRWQGLEQRNADDQLHRRERLRRKRKLTAAEQDELDNLNHELQAA